MEKLQKIRFNFIGWVEKHLDLLIVLIVVIASLILRCFLFTYKSSDFIKFLYPWFNEIKMNGGFKYLGHYPGNYNVPYAVIMTFLTYLKINPLYSIKIVSVIFDYALAILIYKFIYEINKNRYYAVLGFTMILFLPTVLLNGSLWAQCDIIYTTFLVLSLYFLYKNKVNWSFVFLGIAFAFKLQFIFVLPVYVILYFKRKDFSLLNFLIIPIVNFVMCLPAIFSGKSVLDCFLIYFKQAGTYQLLTMNFPNLYSLVNGNPIYFSKIGICLTFLIFVLMFYYIMKNKVKFNLENILLLMIWSILICVFFLPHMHERYMFSADIFSLLYLLLYKRNFLVCLLVQMISFVSYTVFLFHNTLVPSYLLAIALLGIIIYLTKDVSCKLVIGKGEE
jgi:Gpi18-like mannosyltransferase